MQQCAKTNVTSNVQPTPYGTEGNVGQNNARVKVVYNCNRNAGSNRTGGGNVNRQ